MMRYHGRFYDLSKEESQQFEKKQGMQCVINLGGATRPGKHQKFQNLHLGECNVSLS